MDADRLFLRRCEQITQLLSSADEIDILDLSDKLRRMLVDQHSLVDLVNANKVRLVFHVGVFSNSPVCRDAELLILEDGLDPETRRPGAPSIKLSRDDFPAHVVIRYQGREFTIKDVIKHAANVEGGVHLSPQPRAEYKAIHATSRTFNIGGLPLSIRQLRAIARVTLRALEPLIADVKARAS